MKRFQNIVLLVLIALAGKAFGQETTGWEFDHLQGKVKTYTECGYEFDISDSINHDVFMMRFYQCGFDIERMIHFGDSIKTENDLKSSILKEYDSLGGYTRWSYSSEGDNNETFYQNEYGDHGLLLRRIIIEDIDSVDTISFLYDSVDRLVERRYKNYMHQWGYDSKGRLAEYRYMDILLDSALILEKYEYDKKGVLRRSEKSGSRERIGCSKGCYEYDSRGNVIFERECDWGVYVPFFECKTRYKYDKNDSIIKETRNELKWVNEARIKDTVWKEIDSEGRVVERFGYTSTSHKTKRMSKSERIITRNTNGFPIEEVFEEYDNSASRPRYTNNKKYDELGRVVEETIEGVGYNPMRKKVIKYYKNTGLWEHYAVYIGKECGFDHESLFFYDDHDNCIAHIQWMPGAQQYEYYYSVYRYEYYE